MVRYLASLLPCNNTLTSLMCSPCFQPLVSLFCSFSVPSSTICVSSSYLSLFCHDKSCRCSVVIAARLHLSYSLCLSNLVSRYSAVSLSCHRLYCSLICLSLFSTPSIVPINHHQCTFSNLQRNLSCGGQLY